MREMGVKERERKGRRLTRGSSSHLKIELLDLFKADRNSCIEL